MRFRSRSVALRGRGFGGAAWTPAALSGLAAAPVVALMRAQGKLWQDAAKTVPATADGDPVHVAVDQVNGVEWTAPGSSSRPVLTDEGDGWSLVFDGVDDELVASGIDPDGNDLWTLFYRGTPQAGTDSPFDNYAILFTPETGSWGKVYFGIAEDGGAFSVGWRFGTGQSGSDVQGAWAGGSGPITCLVEHNGPAGTETFWVGGASTVSASGKLSDLANNAASMRIGRGGGGTFSAIRARAWGCYAGLRSEELETYLGGR